MSEKKLLADIDASSSQTTAAVLLGDITHYSGQISFTGADLAGAFKIQVSNDGVQWVDLSTTNVVAAQSVLINVSDAGYKQIRFVWTYTSGSGNLTITFFGKEVNFKYR